ncbi:uncharacterized protein K489DRAFT_267155 [Dissoconium aciculare CBS 342.82]|uniref:Uncharacterized protein n=1 Tax=Dissoconium aciculare CBS 342.82 TaxID=1314786 RepID=A0A6J3LZR3_9PEZI|nr:uncharacterized protein K489DRAFT_267155 [Dissoconium aciculare CBS 342.82]KAF1821148.1 hypothetical protein K489DRAFT_267155 [Dissoconium aciculare CBS 342.82]
MPATLEKPFQASRPPCAFRSHPDDFPSTYEQQVNENLRHFAKAAESRQEFYPLENGMPRRKTFNRRRCQIIICVVLVLVALATILAAIGTSTGFLSGTGASQSPSPLAAENDWDAATANSAPDSVVPHNTDTTPYQPVLSIPTPLSLLTSQSVMTMITMQDAQSSQTASSLTNQGSSSISSTTMSSATGLTSLPSHHETSQSAETTVVNKSARIGLCGLPGMGCGW